MVTRRMRFELWLATTAMALVVTGLSLPVQSAPLTEEEISAAVPMPEPANLPPPTISDIAPVTPAESPAPARPRQAGQPAAAGDSAQPSAAPRQRRPPLRLHRSQRLTRQRLLLRPHRQLLRPMPPC
jgi:hypothetical protein